MENVFAYTAPSGDYPGYISVNRDDVGNVTVTVRSAPTAHQITGYPHGCCTVSPGEQASFMVPASEPEAALLAANARLIAAAPDMLAALERLTALDSDGEAGCCVDPIEYGEALNSARALIQKARGQ
jgi:hypothetical protein